MAASHRIAVYGGTFDPVHNGHIEVASQILKLFSLDEVLFMPAYVAPHKQRAIVSSAFHRYAMLVLATEDDDRLRISTAELDAGERVYTVETLARLRERFGDTTRLFFIMGADSWTEIRSWRDWERLLQLCDHIVVTRPGYDLDAAGVPAAAETVIDLRGLGGEEVAALLSEEKGPRVFITDAVMVDASATDIRAAARAGDREKLAGLIPARVVNYIEKYGLYRNVQ
jgi:nicotinate-nucleotide adenylyltransferase